MKTNKVVNAISKLHFAGNIIPHSWFDAIALDSGKPDLVAIIILSEIIYWYRGTLLKDENTLKVIGYRKRFEADKLQLTSKVLGNRFGFSKRQVSNAITRLCESNLITVEYRKLELQSGTINNIQFVEPNPDEIEKISFHLDATLRNQLRDPAQSITIPCVINYAHTKTTDKEYKHETTGEEERLAPPRPQTPRKRIFATKIYSNGVDPLVKDIMDSDELARFKLTRKKVVVKVAEWRKKHPSVDFKKLLIAFCSYVVNNKKGREYRDFYAAFKNWLAKDGDWGKDKSSTSNSKTEANAPVTKLLKKRFEV